MVNVSAAFPHFKIIDALMPYIIILVLFNFWYKMEHNKHDDNESLFIRERHLMREITSFIHR